MKRRSLGLLAGASAAALKFGFAKAQSAKDPTLLTTTLTPMGSERAGNADGSIPAWTGGYTTVPAGWQPGDYMPDFFADEQPVVVIDASNMAQHADKLSDGVMAMMTKYGYSIKVYPTHRTAALPQWVYDNIAKNLMTAQLDPAGGRLGFLNAYGGYPFPIPDTSDPLAAGAQIIWNHETRWQGEGFHYLSQGWNVVGGQPVLSDLGDDSFTFPYYKRGGSWADYDGIENRYLTVIKGPPNLQGEEVVIWAHSDPYRLPDNTWELLNGQGRVRRAPELSFDTPVSYSNGMVDYDEYFMFQDSLEEYDWKYLGKKEMYIPYNNNGAFLVPAPQGFKAHFIDPDIIRWELHRVWVVEATLHPGRRNVLARRRFYSDEDTWAIGLGDAWDANNNLFHTAASYNMVRPELPGVIMEGTSINNLQTDNYTVPDMLWNEKAHPTLIFNSGYPTSTTDPQNMAASAQY